MVINLFFVFVSSLVICMGLIPFLIKGAAYFNVLDLPGGRKMHSAPIARVGGIAFAAGALASILIWVPVDRIIFAYLGGSAIIIFFGVMDDRINLDFKFKLLAQLIAAAFVMGVGEIRLSTLPFLEEITLPIWLGLPLTILLLVGVTNAINLSDGLDGLAGGLSLLSLGGMAYLAFLSDDALVLSISLSVMGGILGFLRFNTYPARIFMGDGGSQFLGFSVGVAAILLTDPGRGGYSPLVVLMIIGLPILDTISVMGQRRVEGRSLFSADRNHLHHKLLTIGFFHHEAVTLIYGFQGVMVSVAVLFYWRGEAEIAIALTLLTLLFFSLIVLARRGRLKFRRIDREEPFANAPSLKDQESRPLNDLPTHLLGIGISLFLIVSVFIPRQVPIDFGLMAIALFALLLVGLWFFQRSAPLLVRLGLYVGGTFVVYLSEGAPPAGGWPIHTILNLFFVFAAVLVFVSIQLNREKPFQTTPLDYLVLFVSLVAPALPGMRIGEVPIGLMGGKLIVLFFAYELLLSRLSARLTQWGLVALWALLVLGVRAWMV
ncbi:MAG: MraY family glycosyltransferase [Candidatus Manganitrophus sp.]|nr:MAG: MraY family glycosyltransferase [Candidatus Manganitrophus sp.]